MEADRQVTDVGQKTAGCDKSKGNEMSFLEIKREQTLSRKDVKCELGKLVAFLDLKENI